MEKQLSKERLILSNKADAFKEELVKLMKKHGVMISVHLIPGNRLTRLLARFVKVEWKLIIREENPKKE